MPAIEADDLDDGRKKGDWKSAYKDAWGQICFEGGYLVFIMFLCLFLLWSLLRCAISLEEGKATSSFLCSIGVCDPVHPTMLVVLFYFVSGMLGAATFSTKWLYHSVARRSWHRDRIVWRLCVPLMGGILAVFVSFIFAKTFGILFDQSTLGMPTIAQLSGFSFLVGIFADGVMAMLERLARNIFGTLESFSGK